VGMLGACVSGKTIYVYTREHVQERETRDGGKQGLIAVCSSRMIFSLRDSRFWLSPGVARGGRLLSTNCNSCRMDKLRKIGVRVDKTCSNLNKDYASD